MGARVLDEPLTAARDRHRRAVDELPLDARHLSRGDPAIPTEYVSADDADRTTSGGRSLE